MRVVVTHVTGARKGERDLFKDLDSISIGRSQDSRLRLGINDTRASARHAVLTFENDRYFVVDVGSTNGTFVNGARVTTPRRLTNGDIVRVGQTDFRVDV